MVGVPHLIEYIVPSRRMHKHQDISKVVKVVQVNNAIDVRIARSILLATTHTKPIFLTLLTDQSGIGQSQHDTNVGHYDLSAFILVYSQGFLSVVLLVVEV